MDISPYDVQCQDFYNYDIASKQPIVSYAEIKKTNSLHNVITEIKQQVDFNQQKILIVLDVDDTILLTYIKIHANEEVEQRIILENNITDAINNIAEYADVICLTARAKLKECQFNLKKYGFNLTNKLNKITLNKTQQLIMASAGTDYADNIIYTNHSDKGKALNMFYNFSNTKYDKVFFIDDIEDNCASVNSALTHNNIQVQTYNITVNTDDLATNLSTKNKVPTLIQRKPKKQQALFHQ